MRRQWGWLILLVSVSIAETVVVGADQSSTDNAAKSSVLRFSGGVRGGEWQMVVDQIERYLTSEGIKIVSRDGGGVENIKRLNDKTADIGLTCALFLSTERYGATDFEIIATEKVRLISNLYPQIFYAVVRKDYAKRHNLSTLADLLATPQARMETLRRGSATEIFLRIVLRFGYGASLEQLEREKKWSIKYGSYTEMIDDLESNLTDGFFYTGGPDVPMLHDLEKYCSIVILPLTDASLEKLHDKLYLEPHLIPVGQYAATLAATRTVGDWVCLAARDDLPETLVEVVLKTIWRNRENIRKVVGDFQYLQPKSALPDGLPVHSGARKFWQTVK